MTIADCAGLMVSTSALAGFVVVFVPLILFVIWTGSAR